MFQTQKKLSIQIFTMIFAKHSKLLENSSNKESEINTNRRRDHKHKFGSGGSSGGASGCTEDNGGCDSQHRRKTYHRHTPEQIQRLEGVYKECPHPDGNQRRELGMELGLEPRQVKFWFQNKRTQMKVLNERVDNDSLRMENDRIQRENTAIQVVLKNMSCSSCGGLPSGEEERKQYFQKLQQENVALKSEYDRMSNILVKCMGRPLSRATFDLPDVSPAGHGSESLVREVNFLAGKVNTDNLKSVNQMNENTESENLLMAKTAATAMDELIKLLLVDQPFWIKGPEDDHYVMDCDSYKKIFPGSRKFGYLTSRMESSKYSNIVAMNARFLVDLYLDPDKWVDLFPTVVSKARTLQVLEAGLLENRSGSLQLIYEEMHILSPLICPRKFNLLQHCQQIGTGVWVILDVSYNCFKGCSHTSSTCCWKYPSGCMIQEMPNGMSKVTCVEHVEVDDVYQFHPIYENLVKSTMGFGAKRLIMALQKTCELYSYLIEAVRPGHVLTKGRSSMVTLACRMVKNYCTIFHLFGAADFHQESEVDSSRVKITAQKNTDANHPIGIVICAASSFWVPATPVRVFGYLNDHMTRSQWDVLCDGNPMYEILHIPTGSHSADAISVLQKSMVGPSESLIVYAPIDAYTMIEVVTGKDSSSVPILASGFAITPGGPDARAAPSSSRNNPTSGGSLITVAFQILSCSSLNSEDGSISMLPVANDIVSRTIQVIETAFALSS